MATESRQKDTPSFQILNVLPWYPQVTKSSQHSAAVWFLSALVVGWWACWESLFIILSHSTVAYTRLQCSKCGPWNRWVNHHGMWDHRWQICSIKRQDIGIIRKHASSRDNDERTDVLSTLLFYVWDSPAFLIIERRRTGGVETGYNSSPESLCEGFLQDCISVGRSSL